jgi:hypothetical protein
VISGEEGAQRERLKYVLSHGAKEGLVDNPRDWPGVHSIRPSLEGTPDQGTWFDRTKEYAAGRRGDKVEPARYATTYTVTLSPLPCWEDLPPELQKRRIEEIVREIDEEEAARRKEKDMTPMGPDAIRRQQPHEMPASTKKSPAPLFIAATRRVRDDLRAGYYAFVAAFREAADKLKAGDRSAAFPIGSFPLAMSFVGG